MALASSTIPAPVPGFMMGLLWRARGSGAIIAPVFSRGVGVWLLPSANALVSEFCSVDCSRMSSEGLSGAAAALEEGL